MKWAPAGQIIDNLVIKVILMDYNLFNKIRNHGFTLIE